MTTYLFLYNIQSEFCIEDFVLISELKRCKADFTILETTTNDLPGRSIWIRKEQFKEAIQTLDPEMEETDIYEMFERRVNNPEYHFVSRFGKTAINAFDRIRFNSETKNVKLTV